MITEGAIRELFLPIRNNNKFDTTLSLSRVLGMLFIIMCHLGNHFNNAVISQVFNVGVPLFFVISGILYAGKNIDNAKAWILKRTIRLYMPLTAWFLYSLVTCLIRGHLGAIELKSLILTACNLQGLRHLYVLFPSIDGPWFFTIIFICYALLIPYKKIESKYSFNPLMSFCVLFVIQCLMAFLNFDLTGLFYFFCGYNFAKCVFAYKKPSEKIIQPCIIIVLSGVLRIISKYLVDGGWIYNQAVVPFCHFFFAIGIILLLKAIRYRYQNTFDKVVSSGVIQWLDRISVYAYCFHGVFLVGELTVFRDGLPLFISVLSVFVLTFLLSTILYLLFEPVGKKLQKIFHV